MRRIRSLRWRNSYAFAAGERAFADGLIDVDFAATTKGQYLLYKD
jgi:hypothetical protein